MLKIALRNILRNKRRTALTGLAIGFAVMVVIYVWSLVVGITDDIFYNFVKLNSGHIRILNKDYLRRERMLPLESNIVDHDEIEKKIGSDPDVVLSTGRIKFGVLLDYRGKNEPVMGVGVDPKAEDSISNISAKLISGRKIRPGAEEINLGDRLARDLGLKLGDTFTIVTQTAYGSLGAMNLKVVGIFRFGVMSVDGNIFYMPLDKAQELLDLNGKVTEIFVLIKDMNKAPLVAKKLGAQLNNKYDAVPWQDQGVIWLWMRIARYIYGVIYFLILLLSSFAIMNTMFMAVMERMKEIGMMKSLGMKNSEVVGVILLEAMMIGIFASFIGAVFGSVIAYFLSTTGLDFTQVFEKLSSNVNFPASFVYKGAFRFEYILMGFCFGVFFSVLAAVPPALKAAKIEPSEALRST